jgi:CubicO group peptidase (beta-lactamase class C family)
MGIALWNRWLVLVFILTAAPIVQAAADSLPRARPEQLGFSAARLDYIDKFFGQKVERGEIAGVVTLVARHGRLAHFTAVGYADAEAHRKMEVDTIFRLYSMTKPIAAVALMMLYQEGRFQLNDPISKYIPEFTSLRVLRDPGSSLTDTVPLERPPSVEDLLRHTAGFTHCWGPDVIGMECARRNVFGLDVPLSDMMSRLATIPLHNQPGTQYLYSIAPDVEARLVEVLSGMTFEEYLEQRLFGPLGMRDTGYYVSAERAKRLAGVQGNKDHQLPTLFTQENAWSVNSYTSRHLHHGGSIGLASTAADYWRFGQMLLNHGEFHGVRILSPEIVRFMTSDHLGSIKFHEDALGRVSEDAFELGLGFAVVKNAAAAGFPSPKGAYFWQGAMGTLFWVDPKSDMVVVAMIQSATGQPEFWTQVRTLVYSALMN